MTVEWCVYAVSFKALTKSCRWTIQTTHIPCVYVCCLTEESHKMVSHSSSHKYNVKLLHNKGAWKPTLEYFSNFIQVKVALKSCPLITAGWPALLTGPTCIPTHTRTQHARKPACRTWSTRGSPTTLFTCMTKGQTHAHSQRRAIKILTNHATHCVPHI